MREMGIFHLSEARTLGYCGILAVRTGKKPEEFLQIAVLRVLEKHIFVNVNIRTNNWKSSVRCIAFTKGCVKNGRMSIDPGM